MTRPFSTRLPLASAAIGVAVAIVFSGVVIGLFDGHLSCEQGPKLGTSEPLATPYVLGVPPPGGLVNWSMNITRTSYASVYPGTNASTSYPVANTSTSLDVLNWTLYSETSNSSLGLGPAGSCPAYSLVVTLPEGGGCTGCVVAQGTPAGVGEQSQIPGEFSFETFASVALDASYGARPVASFTWRATGGSNIDLVSSTNLSHIFGSTGPFLLNGSFVGLGLEANLTSIEFGVPISSGGESLGTYSATLPSGMPGTSLEIALTYIFPASVDQGTWEVFEAGAGSPYPAGGFLFEQTA
jgi:hypothetical protein